MGTVIGESEKWITILKIECWISAK